MASDRPILDCIAPKPMPPERLAEAREIAEHPATRQLVETNLIRELLDDRDWHDREVERLRAALHHIANGNLSPCITFAKRILEGDSIEEAHRKNVAEWKR